jgi:phospholipase/carboxylesterase
MSGQDFETVELQTGSEPEVSIIWLHGLGADGHDFEPVVPQLANGLPPARFVFPHAPVRPVTINAGIPMRAWYDIVTFDRHAPQDQQGIAQSRQLVERLVAREEARGIPSERIVLAGFSQGGAMAVYCGLRLAQPLAGIMGLSTYLLMAQALAAERSDANAGTGFFVGHGTYDPVIPVAAGHRLAAALREMAYEVEWHEYSMPHAVCPEELSDIGAWLARCFSGADAA